MQIKLYNISNIIESLNQIIDKDIPIKLSYKLTKLYKKLAKELEQFEESRVKLINKYGEKDENGKLNVKENGTVSIVAEDMQKFQDELLELSNIELEIEFEKIRLEELENAGVRIAGKYLMALDDFIVE